MSRTCTCLSSCSALTIQWDLTMFLYHNTGTIIIGIVKLLETNYGTGMGYTVARRVASTLLLLRILTLHALYFTPPV